MTVSTADKRAAFARLHQQGCFVLPNPWDAGSAIALQSLGFKALASTSAGMAWAMGRPDGGVTVDEVVAHLAMLVGVTSLPVNADFENGFADAPRDVAVNVAKAAATGVAGLSIEDFTGDKADPLYDFHLAVERIAAAREAAGPDVVLTARAEGFLRGRPDLDETLRRLRAYAEAGADCLYAPGIAEDAHIRAVVEAVAPKAVNVLTFGRSVAELEALGARRISLGSGLASAAWGEFLRASREIAADGTFGFISRGIGGRELNPLFAEAAAPR
jgi:2-methylisocitrate lyase-like PEP mutase family enzyme